MIGCIRVRIHTMERTSSLQCFRVLAFSHICMLAGRISSNPVLPLLTLCPGESTHFAESPQVSKVAEKDSNLNDVPPEGPIHAHPSLGLSRFTVSDRASEVGRLNSAYSTFPSSKAWLATLWRFIHGFISGFLFVNSQVSSLEAIQCQFYYFPVWAAQPSVTPEGLWLHVTF